MAVRATVRFVDLTWRWSFELVSSSGTLMLRPSADLLLEAFAFVFANAVAIGVVG